MPKTVRSDGFIEYRGWWWQLARPGVILAVHGGLIVTTCGAALRRGLSGTRLSIGLCLGYAVWTLFEYVLHRWFLHHRRYRPVQALFWKRLHREHHQYRAMKDPDHHGVHVAVSLPIAALLVLIVAICESPLALAGVAGWIAGYLMYELLHWIFHAAEPDSWLGRIAPLRSLWEAHTVHHLVTMNANFGFVTMCWDRAFRTYRLP